MVRFKALKTDYYDEAAFVAAAQVVLIKTERDFKDGFDSTVRGWKHKVRWINRRTVDAQTARLIYGTNDKIYGYVNDGTRPHDIEANKKKLLRFRGGYRAKTRRGSLSSGPGGATGGWFSAKKVHHPGTEPREFSKEVVRRTKPKFEGYVKAEFDRATLKRKARP